ncbi:class A beta-lactamase-related serine hydrolase [Micromonospora fluostatini]|uniref:Class A beta-lactamase-related serine hydrolase n=1 Tax=Micromonospora fluostatini TaxID=1629071 RepID=A0ABY2DFQ6_9ACTN|nr:class A beta-lactamase-related serine hydrolase [Micromonospora fluostatini]
MSVTRTTDPDLIGFDPARLARIDEHFGRYVDDGRLAGWQIVVTRRGEIAHSRTYGARDAETGAPVGEDTLWRIYSMTKPVTSVAAMMLWEEGRFELTDEISRWLPEFADMRVYSKGSVLKPYTVPAAEPIRVWHLLTHTAGLTYGFMQTSVVDGLYRAAGYELMPPPGVDLAGACAVFGEFPLLFQPLGMTDTRWWVEEADAERLAALYVPDPRTGRAVRHDRFGAVAREKPGLHSGGAGLISSAADYHRFTQMLLRGGELDGARLLGPRTVRFMTRNHLPGGHDLATHSVGGFSETIFDGVGFGLGFAVIDDPVPSRLPSSVGEYYWGGIASTAFWVDPAQELTALLFTQLMPSSTWPLRTQLRQLVYAALVD